MIQGTTIYLIPQIETVDAFNNAIYTDGEPVAVENVLIAPSSTDDVTTSVSLYGKEARYTLGLPKGDTHEWKDQIVEFFGHRWQVIGLPIEGIEANVPTAWHKKLLVTTYEG